MKKTKLIYLIMFWIFFSFLNFIRPIRKAIQQDGNIDNIYNQILSLFAVLLIILLVGLFNLYKWAINMAIALVFVFAIMPVINIAIIGIANWKIATFVLVAEIFNILILIYLLKPQNRKYFQDFREQKEKDKNYRKLGNKMGK